MSSNDSVVGADLLVVGAGMAGLTAAATAARAGQAVLVVDQADEIGGSAALSGGILWTARTTDDLAREDPAARGGLGAIVVQDYPDLVSWVASLGVDVGPEVDVLYGRGRRIDILRYLRRCVAIVEGAGGWVLTNRSILSLLQDVNGTVVGARVRDRDGLAEIRARWTLLATGGFQASNKFVAKHLGPDVAQRLLLRSNPHSRGVGLQLAQDAGAATAGRLDAFYGHLIVEPAGPFKPEHYARLATIYSDRALLVDAHGHRFTDEALGDHHSAQVCARQADGKCLMIMDRVLTDEVSARPNVAGGEAIDRVREARAVGAGVAVAETLEELPAAAESLGINGPAALESLVQFNVSPGPARRALDVPPWTLLVLRPALTFTQGGICTDEHAQVLRRSGAAVPGLLAAGADVGGVFFGGYGGGLAAAGGFGRRAGMRATTAPAVSTA